MVKPQGEILVTRVIIADDHPIVRKGLKQILTEAGDMSVDEAASIPELRERLLQSVPQVLVLDVNMPGGSGLEFLAEVRQHYPRLPVLILSVFGEAEVGIRAISGGARGFLNKQTAPDQIVDAVRKLRAGGRFITPELAEAVADHLEHPDRTSTPHLLLSEREHTVLRMIASGKTTGEIAELLGLSPKTVSTYRTRILEKMGMSSTAELVRYVVEHGLSTET